MWESEAEGALETSLRLVWLSRPGPYASVTVLPGGHDSLLWASRHILWHCWAGQAGHRECTLPYQARLSWLENSRSRCEGSLPGIQGRWCQLMSSLLPAAADQVQVSIVQTPLEERGILTKVGVSGISSPDAEGLGRDL